jgi:hypothetical protein
VELLVSLEQALVVLLELQEQQEESLQPVLPEYLLLAQLEEQKVLQK